MKTFIIWFTILGIGLVLDNYLMSVYSKQLENFEVTMKILHDAMTQTTGR